MKRAHFRVVQGRKISREDDIQRNASNFSTLVPHGYQLSLPFAESAEDCKIFVAVVDEIHGLHLCDVIFEYRPEKVIDIRHLVRFDLPGIFREMFFNLIDRANSKYIRIPIPWHQLSIREIMSGQAPISNELIRAIVETKDGRLLLLVSSFSEAERLEIVINRVFSEVATCPWNVERIPD